MLCPRKLLFQSSLSFWPYPALMPQVCASHLLPLPERRAAIAQDHASGLQDVGMVGDAESHMSVLLDEEHGRPGSADLADDAEDLLDQQRCKSKGRLVEQKQARPCHQRPSDGEHLLLAAAQRSGALPQPLAKAWEIVEHARLLPARGTDLPSGVPAEQQVLAHREVREDLSSLRHLNDPGPHQAVWRRSID